MPWTHQTERSIRGKIKQLKEAPCALILFINLLCGFIAIFVKLGLNKAFSKSPLLQLDCSYLKS